MKGLFNILVGSSVCFLFAIANQPVNAATISVTNSGFETPDLEGVEPVIGDEIFTFDPPTGWQLYDPFNLIPTETNLTTSYTGVWHPSTAFYPNGVPEGDNIGAIFLNQTPGSGVVGLSQTLNSTLEANTEYTLQVSVGNPGSSFFAGFPGYKIQFLAGETAIAEDNSLIISEGNFSTSTIVYRTSNNDPNLGQPIQIRLLNTLETEGLEVNFDNIQLEAIPISETRTTPESNSFLAILGCAIYLLIIKIVRPQLN